MQPEGQFPSIVRRGSRLAILQISRSERTTARVEHVHNAKVGNTGIIRPIESGFIAHYLDTI